MKLIRTFAFFVFFAVSLVASAQDTGKLDPNAFEKKAKETPSAVVLDVRGPDEYASGHLPNAVNIDWSNATFSDKVSELDKAKPVMVYCYSGHRSHEAAVKMRDMGFNVVELDGGIKAWMENGKKTVKK
jgi:rhodanese-related sulfurtransferase